MKLKPLFWASALCLSSLPVSADDISGWGESYLVNGAKAKRASVWDDRVTDRDLLHTICAGYELHLERADHFIEDKPQPDWVAKLLDNSNEFIVADGDSFKRAVNLAKNLRERLIDFAGEPAVREYERNMPYRATPKFDIGVKEANVLKLKNDAALLRAALWTAEVPGERQLTGLCRMYYQSLSVLFNNVSGQFAPTDEKKWVPELLLFGENSTSTRVKASKNAAQWDRGALLRFASEKGVAAFEEGLPLPANKP